MLGAMCLRRNWSEVLLPCVDKHFFVTITKNTRFGPDRCTLSIAGTVRLLEPLEESSNEDTCEDAWCRCRDSSCDRMRSRHEDDQFGQRTCRSGCDQGGSLGERV